MAVWALNVKLTGPLVVTAGSALENYPWWTPESSNGLLGPVFGLCFEKTLQIAPSDLGAQRSEIIVGSAAITVHPVLVISGVHFQYFNRRTLRFTISISDIHPGSLLRVYLSF